jgi:hypothetical protein
MPLNRKTKMFRLRGNATLRGKDDHVRGGPGHQHTRAFAHNENLKKRELRRWLRKKQAQQDGYALDENIGDADALDEQTSDSAAVDALEDASASGSVHVRCPDCAWCRRCPRRCSTAVPSRARSAAAISTLTTRSPTRRRPVSKRWTR